MVDGPFGYFAIVPGLPESLSSARLPSDIPVLAWLLVIPLVYLAECTGVCGASSSATRQIETMGSRDFWCPLVPNCTPLLFGRGIVVLSENCDPELQKVCMQLYC